MDTLDFTLLEKMKGQRQQTNNIKIIGRVLPTTGKIHQQQEVYDINYVAPICKATHYKNPIRVLVFENERSLRTEVSKK